jgi:hypothetical protein
MLLLLQLQKDSGALEWEFNKGRVVLREPQEKKKKVASFGKQAWRAPSRGPILP